MSRHGMEFEDVRKRLLRIKETERQGKVKNYEQKANLEKSLLGQVRRREGDGAVKELLREIRSR